MLVNDSKLLDAPILSLQAGGLIARIDTPIIDPDKLKIIGFKAKGGVIGHNSANILDVSSVREYSSMGLVIDSDEEFMEKDDVIKIAKILDLHFSLIGLKVETKKGSKLGKVIGFTFTDNDFMIQQLIVKRPVIKAFLDPELIIPRKEIVKIDDYKVTVKDEEKTIQKKAETTEFVPNFVNPFRQSESAQPEPDYVPIQNQTPGESNTV